MSFLERLRMISLGQVVIHSSFWPEQKGNQQYIHCAKPPHSGWPSTWRPCDHVTTELRFVLEQIFCFMTRKVLHSPLQRYVLICLPICSSFCLSVYDSPYYVTIWVMLSHDEQGQGPIAESMIASGREGGEWVYLQASILQEMLRSILLSRLTLDLFWNDWGAELSSRFIMDARAGKSIWIHTIFLNLRIL